MRSIKQAVAVDSVIQCVAFNKLLPLTLVLGGQHLVLSYSETETEVGWGLGLKGEGVPRSHLVHFFLVS